VIPVRCPICAKSFSIASLDDLPTFPFCSERCRLIDLGRWIDGAYAIPAGTPLPEEPASTEEDEEAE
jgi:uncharacterized protein